MVYGRGLQRARSAQIRRWDSTTTGLDNHYQCESESSGHARKYPGEHDNHNPSESESSGHAREHPAGAVPIELQSEATLGTAAMLEVHERAEPRGTPVGVLLAPSAEVRSNSARGANHCPGGKRQKLHGASRS